MPSLELHLPSSLREFAHGASTVRLDAATVGDALRAWSAPNATLTRRLFGNDGRLRESVALFLNGRPLDGVARSDTSVREGDRLEIVASLAGG